MKNIKNSKNILIIIVFALLIISLILVIIKTKNDKAYLNKEAGLETYAPGAPMSQLYSSAVNPTLKSDDKIFGSSAAKIKLFVYEDNASIYSARLAETLDKVYLENKDNLAIIVRPFITNNSSFSKDSALAIECAGDQNKWREMRALLFMQVKNGSLNLLDLNSYAEQISLDSEAFNTCLTNKNKSAKIEELSAEASSYNVIGAPTIFIDNEILLGARPYEDYTDSSGDQIEGLKTLINKKLQ